MDRNLNFKLDILRVYNPFNLRARFINMQSIVFFCIIMLYICSAVCCTDEFKVRCDERCKYEWDSRGAVLKDECKCLITMDIKSKPPLKVPTNTPEKKKIKNYWDGWE